MRRLLLASFNFIRIKAQKKFFEKRKKKLAKRVPLCYTIVKVANK